MGVTINSPDDDIDRLRQCISMELAAIPSGSWDVSEAGSVLFILRAIREGRYVVIDAPARLRICR
jgi:hypothetical protein